MAEYWAAAKPFLTGSVAGCLSTCVIQPVDMVKVRLQLGAAEGGSTSPFTVAANLIKNDGIKGLYKGIDAAWTRQFFYTGTRLGLFDKFTEIASVPGERMPFWKTAICAVSAGGMGAVVGNPADLSLIRMQADSMLPPAERRGYTSIGNAVASIVKEEGALGLLKGAGPTAQRAMALNFGMLGFNSVSKDLLADVGVQKNTTANVWGAAWIAGFFAAFFSLPFDYVKTQIQKMTPDPVTGEMPFKGPVDCAVQQVKAGGITRLWTGFPTYYVRAGGHAFFTLVFQDVVKNSWSKMGL